jgi:hypothetical protein
MVDAPTFDELIRRVRVGKQDAATELLRRYKPAIRGAGCILLEEARLGLLLDSIDICRSVMASFFIRAASGQSRLRPPRSLHHERIPRRTDVAPGTGRAWSTGDDGRCGAFPPDL